MALKNVTLEKVKRYVLKLLGDVGDQEAEEVATGAGASKLAKATRVVYAIGTIRVWQGQKYKKTGPNRWDKVFEAASKERDASVAATKAQIKKAPDLATLVRLIGANSKRFLTSEGKMDPIVLQLIRMAKERRETIAPKAKLAAKAVGPAPAKAQEGPEAAKPEPTVESPKPVPEPDAIEAIATKEPKQIEKKVTPVKDAAKALSGASPETRNEVAAQVFGFDPEAPNALPAVYEYKPEKTPVNVGGHEMQFDDFTKVEPIRIALANPKTILDKPKPSYLPMMDERYFGKNGFKVVATRLGEDRYYLKTGQDSAAVVSLDVLAATQHYFLNKAKATFNVAIEKEKARRLEDAKKELARYTAELEDAKDAGDEAKIRGNIRYNLEYYADVVSGKRPFKVKGAPKMLGDNRMTYTQSGLFKQFRPGVNAWTAYREMNQELKQKMGDMAIQYEDMLNTHAKGEETSYGKKGAKTDLLGSLGVLVKRQNGKPITPEETAEVKGWLTDVFGVYGDRSSMARKYGLLISHSGDVGMHARKAIGLFHPTYHAIGVAAGGGGFTMAHEYAHFMDNYLGGKGGYHYASDKRGSPTNEIADTFRRNMAKAQKSDYQKRTCECFARALEQYFAIKTGKGEEYDRQRNGEGNHPSVKTFQEQVMPKIEAWFQENDTLLKSGIRLVIRRGAR